MIAVICGNVQEFIRWAEQHPDLAGGPISRNNGRFTKATAITDRTGVIGRVFEGKIVIGTFNQLPDLPAIERYLRIAKE